MSDGITAVSKALDLSNRIGISGPDDHDEMYARGKLTFARERRELVIEKLNHACKEIQESVVEGIYEYAEAKATGLIALINQIQVLSRDEALWSRRLDEIRSGGR